MRRRTSRKKRDPKQALLLEYVTPGVGSIRERLDSDIGKKRKAAPQALGEESEADYSAHESETAITSEQKKRILKGIRPDLVAKIKANLKNGVEESKSILEEKQKIPADAINLSDYVSPSYRLLLGLDDPLTAKSLESIIESIPASSRENVSDVRAAFDFLSQKGLLSGLIAQRRNNLARGGLWSNDVQVGALEAFIFLGRLGGEVGEEIFKLLGGQKGLLEFFSDAEKASNLRNLCEALSRLDNETALMILYSVDLKEFIGEDTLVSELNNLSPDLGELIKSGGEDAAADLILNTLSQKEKSYRERIDLLRAGIKNPEKRVPQTNEAEKQTPATPSVLGGENLFVDIFSGLFGADVVDGVIARYGMDSFSQMQDFVSGKVLAQYRINPENYRSAVSFVSSLVGEQILKAAFIDSPGKVMNFIRYASMDDGRGARRVFEVLGEDAFEDFTDLNLGFLNLVNIVSMPGGYDAFGEIVDFFGERIGENDCSELIRYVEAVKKHGGVLEALCAKVARGEGTGRFYPYELGNTGIYTQESKPETDYITSFGAVHASSKAQVNVFDLMLEIKKHSPELVNSILRDGGIFRIFRSIDHNPVKSLAYILSPLVSEKNKVIASDPQLAHILNSIGPENFYSLMLVFDNPFAPNKQQIFYSYRSPARDGYSRDPSNYELYGISGRNISSMMGNAYFMSIIKSLEAINPSSLKPKEFNCLIAWALDKNRGIGMKFSRVYSEFLLPAINDLSSQKDLSEEIRAEKVKAIQQMIRVFAAMESDEGIPEKLLQKDAASGEYIFISSLKRLIERKIDTLGVLPSVLLYQSLWHHYLGDARLDSYLSTQENINKLVWLMPIISKVKAGGDAAKIGLMDGLIEGTEKLEISFGDSTIDSIWDLDSLETVNYVMGYLEYGKEAVNLGIRYGQLQPYKIGCIASALNEKSGVEVGDALAAGLSGSQLISFAQGKTTLEEVSSERTAISLENRRLVSELEEKLNANTDQTVAGVLGRIKEAGRRGADIGITAGTARNIVLFFEGRLTAEDIAEYYSNSDDFDVLVDSLRVNPKQFSKRFMEESPLRKAFSEIGAESITLPGIHRRVELGIEKFDQGSLKELNRKRTEKIKESLQGLLPQEIINDAAAVEEILEAISDLTGELLFGADVRGESAAMIRTDLGLNALRIGYDASTGKFKVSDEENALYYAQKGDVRIYSGKKSVYLSGRPMPHSSIEYTPPQILLSTWARYNRVQALGGLRINTEDYQIVPQSLKTGFRCGVKIPGYLHNSLNTKINADLEKLIKDIEKNNRWNIEDTVSFIQSLAPFVNLKTIKTKLEQLLEFHKTEGITGNSVSYIFVKNALLEYMQSEGYGEEEITSLKTSGIVPVYIHGTGGTRGAQIDVGEEEALQNYVGIISILEDGFMRSGSDLKEKYEGTISTEAHGAGIYVSRKLSASMGFFEGAMFVINPKKLGNLKVKNNNEGYGDELENLLIDTKKLSLEEVDRILVDPETLAYVQDWWNGEINRRAKNSTKTRTEIEDQLAKEKFGTNDKGETRQLKDVVKCIYKEKWALTEKQTPAASSSILSAVSQHLRDGTESGFMSPGQLAGLISGGQISSAVSVLQSAKKTLLSSPEALHDYLTKLFNAIGRDENLMDEFMYQDWLASKVDEILPAFTGSIVKLTKEDDSSFLYEGAAPQIMLGRSLIIDRWKTSTVQEIIPVMVGKWSVRSDRIRIRTSNSVYFLEIKEHSKQPFTPAPILPSQTTGRKYNSAYEMPFVDGTPVFGFHGYRVTDEAAADGFIENGGWKLHLNVSEENLAVVDEWLWNNFRGNYKCAISGYGKDFTIHVGGRAEAEAFAQRVVGEIGDRLNDHGTGQLQAPVGDVLLNNKVAARFDIRNTKATSDPELGQYTEYGADGIPFTRQQALKIRRLAEEINKSKDEKRLPELEQLKQEYARGNAGLLTKKYGEYFAGKQTPVSPVSPESGFGAVGAAQSEPVQKPSLGADVEELFKVMSTEPKVGFRRSAADELIKRGWVPLDDVEKAVFLLAKGASSEEVAELGEAAVTPLINVMRFGLSTDAAILSLQSIGAPAVGPLIAALDEDVFALQWQIVKALGGIDDPRVIEPLKNQLNNGNKEVRKAAAYSLDKRGWKPKNDAENVKYLIAKRGYTAVAKLGAPAVETVINLLNNRKRDDLENLVNVLGEIGDVKAEEPLTQLKERYGNGSPTQKTIAQALQKIKEKTVSSLVSEAKNLALSARGKKMGEWAKIMSKATLLIDEAVASAAEIGDVKLRSSVEASIVDACLAVGATRMATALKIALGIEDPIEKTRALANIYKNWDTSREKVLVPAGEGGKNLEYYRNSVLADAKQIELRLKSEEDAAIHFLLVNDALAYTNPDTALINIIGNPNTGLGGHEGLSESQKSEALLSVVQGYVLNKRIGEAKNVVDRISDEAIKSKARALIQPAPATTPVEETSKFDLTSEDISELRENVDAIIKRIQSRQNISADDLISLVSDGIILVDPINKVPLEDRIRYLNAMHFAVEQLKTQTKEDWVDSAESIIKETAQNLIEKEGIDSGKIEPGLLRDVGKTTPVVSGAFGPSMFDRLKSFMNSVSLSFVDSPLFSEYLAKRNSPDCFFDYNGERVGRYWSVVSGRGLIEEENKLLGGRRVDEYLEEGDKYLQGLNDPETRDYVVETIVESINSDIQRRNKLLQKNVPLLTSEDIENLKKCWYVKGENSKILEETYGVKAGVGVIRVPVELFAEYYGVSEAGEKKIFYSVSEGVTVTENGVKYVIHRGAGLVKKLKASGGEEYVLGLNIRPDTRGREAIINKVSIRFAPVGTSYDSTAMHEEAHGTPYIYSIARNTWRIGDSLDVDNLFLHELFAWYVGCDGNWKKVGREFPMERYLDDYLPESYPAERRNEIKNKVAALIEILSEIEAQGASKKVHAEILFKNLDITQAIFSAFDYLSTLQPRRFDRLQETQPYKSKYLTELSYEGRKKHFEENPLEIDLTAYDRFKEELKAAKTLIENLTDKPSNAVTLYHVSTVIYGFVKGLEGEQKTEALQEVRKALLIIKKQNTPEAQSVLGRADDLLEKTETQLSLIHSTPAEVMSAGAEKRSVAPKETVNQETYQKMPSSYSPKAARNKALFDRASEILGSYGVEMLAYGRVHEEKGTVVVDELFLPEKVWFYKHGNGHVFDTKTLKVVELSEEESALISDTQAEREYDLISVLYVGMENRVSPTPGYEERLAGKKINYYIHSHPKGRKEPSPEDLNFMKKKSVDYAAIKTPKTESTYALSKERSKKIDLAEWSLFQGLGQLGGSLFEVWNDPAYRDRMDGISSNLGVRIHVYAEAGKGFEWGEVARTVGRGSDARIVLNRNAPALTALLSVPHEADHVLNDVLGTGRDAERAAAIVDAYWALAMRNLAENVEGLDAAVAKDLRGYAHAELRNFNERFGTKYSLEQLSKEAITEKAESIKGVSSKHLFSGYESFAGNVYRRMGSGLTKENLREKLLDAVLYAVEEDAMLRRGWMEDVERRKSPDYVEFDSAGVAPWTVSELKELFSLVGDDAKLKAWLDAKSKEPNLPESKRLLCSVLSGALDNGTLDMRHLHLYLFNDQVTQGFWVPSRTDISRVAEYAKALAGERDAVIFDYGCGSCLLDMLLIEEGVSVVGLEPDSKLVNKVVSAYGLQERGRVAGRRAFRSKDGRFTLVEAKSSEAESVKNALGIEADVAMSSFMPKGLDFTKDMVSLGAKGIVHFADLDGTTGVTGESYDAKKNGYAQLGHWGIQSIWRKNAKAMVWLVEGNKATKGIMSALEHTPEGRDYAWSEEKARSFESGVSWDAQVLQEAPAKPPEETFATPPGKYVFADYSNVEEAVNKPGKEHHEHHEEIHESHHTEDYHHDELHDHHDAHDGPGHDHVPGEHDHDHHEEHGHGRHEEHDHTHHDGHGSGHHEESVADLLEKMFPEVFKRRMSKPGREFFEDLACGKARKEAVDFFRERGIEEGESLLDSSNYAFLEESYSEDLSPAEDIVAVLSELADVDAILRDHPGKLLVYVAGLANKKTYKSVKRELSRKDTDNISGFADFCVTATESLVEKKETEKGHGDGHEGHGDAGHGDSHGGHGDEHGGHGDAGHGDAHGGHEGGNEGHGDGHGDSHGGHDDHGHGGHAKKLDHELESILSATPKDVYAHFTRMESGRLKTLENHIRDKLFSKEGVEELSKHALLSWMSDAEKISAFAVLIDSKYPLNDLRINELRRDNTRKLLLMLHAFALNEESSTRLIASLSGESLREYVRNDFEWLYKAMLGKATLDKTKLRPIEPAVFSRLNPQKFFENLPALLITLENSLGEYREEIECYLLNHLKENADARSKEIVSVQVSEQIDKIKSENPIIGKAAEKNAKNLMEDIEYWKNRKEFAADAVPKDERDLLHEKYIEDTARELGVERDAEPVYSDRAEKKAALKAELAGLCGPITKVYLEALRSKDRTTAMKTAMETPAFQKSAAVIFEILLGLNGLEKQDLEDLRESSNKDAASERRYMRAFKTLKEMRSQILDLPRMFWGISFEEFTNAFYDVLITNKKIVNLNVASPEEISLVWEAIVRYGSSVRGTAQPKRILFQTRTRKALGKLGRHSDMVSLAQPASSHGARIQALADAAGLEVLVVSPEIVRYILHGSSDGIASSERDLIAVSKGGRIYVSKTAPMWLVHSALAHEAVHARGGSEEEALFSDGLRILEYKEMLRLLREFEGGEGIIEVIESMALQELDTFNQKTHGLHELESFELKDLQGALPRADRLMDGYYRNLALMEREFEGFRSHPGHVNSKLRSGRVRALELDHKTMDLLDLLTVESVKSAGLMGLHAESRVVNAADIITSLPKSDLQDLRRMSVLCMGGHLLDVPGKSKVTLREHGREVVYVFEKGAVWIDGERYPIKEGASHYDLNGAGASRNLLDVYVDRNGYSENLVSVAREKGIRNPGLKDLSFFSEFAFYVAEDALGNRFVEIEPIELIVDTSETGIPSYAVSRMDQTTLRSSLESRGLRLVARGHFHGKDDYNLAEELSDPDKLILFDSLRGNLREAMKESAELPDESEYSASELIAYAKGVGKKALEVETTQFVRGNLADRLIVLRGYTLKTSFGDFKRFSEKLVRAVDSEEKENLILEYVNGHLTSSGDYPIRPPALDAIKSPSGQVISLAGGFRVAIKRSRLRSGALHGELGYFAMLLDREGKLVDQTKLPDDSTVLFHGVSIARSGESFDIKVGNESGMKILLKSRSKKGLSPLRDYVSRKDSGAAAYSRVKSRKIDADMLRFIEINEAQIREMEVRLGRNWQDYHLSVQRERGVPALKRAAAVESPALKSFVSKVESAVKSGGDVTPLFRGFVEDCRREGLFSAEDAKYLGGLKVVLRVGGHRAVHVEGGEVVVYSRGIALGDGAKSEGLEGNSKDVVTAYVVRHEFMEAADRALSNRHAAKSPGNGVVVQRLSHVSRFGEGLAILASIRALERDTGVPAEDLESIIFAQDLFKGVDAIGSGYPAQLAVVKGLLGMNVAAVKKLGFGDAEAKGILERLERDGPAGVLSSLGILDLYLSRDSLEPYSDAKEVESDINALRAMQKKAGGWTSEEKVGNYPFEKAYKALATIAIDNSSPACLEATHEYVLLLLEVFEEGRFEGGLLERCLDYFEEFFPG